MGAFYIHYINIRSLSKARAIMLLYSTNMAKLRSSEHTDSNPESTKFTTSATYGAWQTQNHRIAQIHLLHGEQQRSYNISSAYYIKQQPAP
jgi:hypothetical protein